MDWAGKSQFSNECVHCVPPPENETHKTSFYLPISLPDTIKKGTMNDNKSEGTSPHIFFRFPFVGAKFHLVNNTFRYYN
jgi:hypothetical protein